MKFAISPVLFAHIFSLPPCGPCGAVLLTEGPNIHSWRVMHYIKNYGFPDLQRTSPAERCRMATCVWEYYKTRDDFEPLVQHYIELLSLYDTYDHQFNIAALEQELTPCIPEWKQTPHKVLSNQLKLLWQQLAKAYAKVGDVEGAERTLHQARLVKCRTHPRQSRDSGTGLILHDDELAATVQVLLGVSHGDHAAALRHLQACAVNKEHTTANPFRQLMLAASKAGNATVVLETIVAMRDAGYEVTGEHGAILAKAYGVAGQVAEMAKVRDTYGTGIQNATLETAFFESCLVGRFEDAKELLAQYKGGQVPAPSTIATLFDAYHARTDGNLAAGMVDLMSGNDLLQRSTFHRPVWRTVLSTFTDAADGENAAQFVNELLTNRKCDADSELSTLGVQAVVAYLKQKACRFQSERGGWKEECKHYETLISDVTISTRHKPVGDSGAQRTKRVLPWKGMERSSQFTQAVLEWNMVKVGFVENAETRIADQIAAKRKETNMWLLANKVDGLLGSSSYELTLKLAGITATLYRIDGERTDYPRMVLNAIQSEVDAGDHTLTFSLRTALIAAHLAADQQEEANTLLSDFYGAADVHKANVDVVLPFVWDRLRRGGLKSAVAFLKAGADEHGSKATSQPRVYLPLLNHCVRSNDSSGALAVLELMQSRECPLYENALILAWRACFASQSTEHALAVAAEGQKQCAAFDSLNHCGLLAEAYQRGGENYMFELVPGFADLGLNVPVDTIVEEIDKAVQAHQAAKSHVSFNTFKANVLADHKQMKAKEGGGSARQGAAGVKTREHFWSVAFSQLLSEISKFGEPSTAVSNALVHAHEAKVLEFSSFIMMLGEEMQISDSLANAVARVALVHDAKTKESIELGSDPMAPFKAGLVKPTSGLERLFKATLGSGKVAAAHELFLKDFQVFALGKLAPKEAYANIIRFIKRAPRGRQGIEKIEQNIEELEPHLPDDRLLTICAELAGKKSKVASTLSKRLFDKRLSATITSESTDPRILFNLLRYKIGQQDYIEELDIIFQKLKTVSTNEDQKFYAAQYMLLAYAQRKVNVNDAQALYESIVADHAELYRQKIQLVEGNMIILFCNQLANCRKEKRDYWMNEYLTAMGRLTARSDSLDDLSENVVHAMINAYTRIGDYERALKFCKLVSNSMAYSVISHFEKTLFDVADPQMAIEFLYRAMASRDKLYAAMFLRAFQAFSKGSFDVATFDKFLDLANNDDMEIVGQGNMSKARVLRLGKIYRLKQEVRSALEVGSTLDGGDVTPAWISSKIEVLAEEVRSSHLPNDPADKKIFEEIAALDTTGYAKEFVASL